MEVEKGGQINVLKFMKQTVQKSGEIFFSKELRYLRVVETMFMEDDSAQKVINWDVKEINFLLLF